MYKRFHEILIAHQATPVNKCVRSRDIRQSVLVILCPPPPCPLLSMPLEILWMDLT